MGLLRQFCMLLVRQCLCFLVVVLVVVLIIGIGLLLLCSWWVSVWLFMCGMLILVIIRLKYCLWYCCSVFMLFCVSFMLQLRVCSCLVRIIWLIGLFLMVSMCRFRGIGGVVCVVFGCVLCCCCMLVSVLLIVVMLCRVIIRLLLVVVIGWLLFLIDVIMCGFDQVSGILVLLFIRIVLLWFSNVGLLSRGCVLVFY